MIDLRENPLVPVRRFVRACKRARWRKKVADSTGMELTGGMLLTASLALKRVLVRRLDDAERNVGILLPPSVGGVLANTAVALAGRVSVNLNYTLSQDNLNSCIRQAGLRRVLTSRRVMERLSFQLDVELVYLEDLKQQVSRRDKAASLLEAFVLPTGIVERRHNLTQNRRDDPFTIIFTSGSTGEPKGVVLTARNIGSDIDGVDQSVHIRREDVLLGVLPFFHSFGFTATLWLPLVLGPRAAYHFNPLDAREVGRLCERQGATIVMAAPTFLRGYLKRCTREQMHALNLVVAGAEKLPLELARQFREQFGVEPSEGYGTTELSPVVAVNVPDDRFDGPPGGGTKLGTVGRPLPGIEVKTVDPESGADQPVGEEGLLHVRGPNVMHGYLDKPDETAAVVRQGWYNTGDMARIDADGFIEITGRRSRFSKIGGEMVPHLKVEEALARIVEDPSDDEPQIQVAVTSAPHPAKGERLVVLHRPLPLPVSEIRRRLTADEGLPNLWVPAQDAFVEVEEIPLLGTGKLDLKAVNELAARHFAAVNEPSKVADAI
ncbi:MAG: AMP-binding protein [Planctomycetes bacterium]|nr:AMP-binding protein [Planctomycetota bacterium]